MCKYYLSKPLPNCTQHYIIWDVFVLTFLFMTVLLTHYLLCSSAFSVKILMWTKHKVYTMGIWTENIRNYIFLSSLFASRSGSFTETTKYMLLYRSRLWQIMFLFWNVWNINLSSLTYGRPPRVCRSRDWPQEGADDHLLVTRLYSRLTQQILTFVWVWKY